MIRIWLVAATLGLVTWCVPQPTKAQSNEQSLVDRATLAIQDIVNKDISQGPRRSLTHARAVMICPRLFKAGLILGGEGGECVLLARSGNNTWSYPAFYRMGGTSLGFQIGVQDAQLVLMVMTGKGLQAVLDDQFKFGADASLAVATIGAGVQGATTGALGADIVAFSLTRGLFGGVSLGGSLMFQRSKANASYYGHEMGSRQIVVEMQGANPGADPLRDVLTRYDSGQQQASVAALSAQPVTPAAGSRTQPSPPPRIVQQQSLPPPR